MCEGGVHGGRLTFSALATLICLPIDRPPWSISARRPSASAALSTCAPIRWITLRIAPATLPPRCTPPIRTRATWRIARLLAEGPVVVGDGEQPQLRRCEPEGEVAGR